MRTLIATKPFTTTVFIGTQELGKSESILSIYSDPNVLGFIHYTIERCIPVIGYSEKVLFFADSENPKKIIGYQEGYKLTDDWFKFLEDNGFDCQKENFLLL